MRIRAVWLFVCVLGICSMPAFADFSGWTVTPNTQVYGVANAGYVIPGTFAGFGPMPVVVLSGQNAAYAVTCSHTTQNCDPSGDFEDTLTLSQDVFLTGGQTYDIGFWMGNGSATHFGQSTDITVNGVSLFPYTNYPINIGTGYYLENGSFTAAVDGTVTIAFFLRLSGYGDGGFSFDDFFVDGGSGNLLVNPGFESGATPEPATLLLLGSGVLGLAGVVRRKINL